MTFWKITDTRMNCLISHQEIQDLGYNILELTQNREKTQEFLNLLLEKGKEVLGMPMEGSVQNFYGAFLPDKSLLLSISCDEASAPGVSREEAPGFMPAEMEKMEGEGPVLSYQILFPSLDNVIQFCGIFGRDKAGGSRLYKNSDVYYLMMDFQNTEEGRKAAGRIVSAEEFDGMVEQNAISELFLQEHESCIIEEKAVEKLADLVK